MNASRVKEAVVFIKLDGNYIRMLRTILNISWRQHPTKQQLYSHLSPITKTIQVRWIRPAGHCWRSRDELIRDVLLWTPSHERAKTGRPARTYIQQLYADTGCKPEDLPETMDDKKGVAREGQGYPFWWRDVKMMICRWSHMKRLQQCSCHLLLFVWSADCWNKSFVMLMCCINAFFFY